MFEPPLDLTAARILCTNDDGINGTGLAVLERIALALSDDVWVVAPEQEQSGAGHSLTLRTPLRMRRAGERHYAVEGTPTDAVLMAVGEVLTDRRPDLVLSGVNRGGNLGEDVTYSGTVSAAMEGTLLNIPSIALSQMYPLGERADWSVAETHGPDIIRKLATVRWPANVLMNVNFPVGPVDAVPGIWVVPTGKRKIGDHIEKRTDPRGYPYYWLGPMRQEEPHAPDTDLGVVNNGGIAITPISLDLTHEATMDALKEAF